MGATVGYVWELLYGSYCRICMGATVGYQIQWFLYKFSFFQSLTYIARAAFKKRTRTRNRKNEVYLHQITESLISIWTYRFLLLKHVIWKRENNKIETWLERKQPNVCCYMKHYRLQYTVYCIVLYVQCTVYCQSVTRCKSKYYR